MIIKFLILIIFPILLFSSQQIILVVADDFHTSQASLEFYEDDKILLKSDVNIGEKGLGWGIGEVNLVQTTNSPQKVEGDKKAPIGVFKLNNIFGYAHKNNYKLPYLHTSKSLICVDDSNSPVYNHIIEANGDEKSFEFMQRRDAQYELGVTVAHNKLGEFGRGSCIFLHVQKGENKGTAGCTSMKLEVIKSIVNLLDAKKNPILIQIPKSSSSEILHLYPQLKNSKLLL